MKLFSESWDSDGKRKVRACPKGVPNCFLYEYKVRQGDLFCLFTHILGDGKPDKRSGNSKCAGCCYN